MRGQTVEYFAEASWWTPNQIRDSFYDFVSESLTTEKVNALKLLAINEQTRRKNLPKEFVECSYCKGYHGQLNNIDNLCENHEAFFAPMKYDANFKNETKS